MKTISTSSRVSPGRSLSSFETETKKQPDKNEPEKLI